MMEKWHFNVLFFVGVISAVVMLLGPEIGLDIDKNPTAVTGVGLILGYVLAQKERLTKSPPNEEQKKSPKKEENDDV